MTPLRLSTLAAFATLALSAPARSQVSPGRAVLEKMHAAYAGKWYRTLTFVQKTTQYRPGQPDRVQTWWESLRYTPQFGPQLRIDAEDLTSGNGSLSTADTTWIVRNGMLAQVRPGGNEFLPWIEGVYFQPLDVTERQVRAMGIDMSKARKGIWRGRPVTVIGVAGEDTTRSQAWIDDERQVIVRMIVADSARPPLSIFLDDYVRAGGGWLETKVDIYIDGVLRQREEYSDWKADVPLPDALFDPAQWQTAPHWGRKPAHLSGETPIW